MLDYEQIKEIITKIDDSSLRIFELEDKDIKLKLSKNTTVPISSEDSDVITRVVKEEVASTEVVADNKKLSENVSATTEVKKEDDSDLKKVKSPLVGTYYSSATPNGTPYVSVGSKVKKGDTLCIIEAMKVMNEVTCEYDGEIVEVLMKDEDIVEYGMDLFKIKEI